MLEVLFVFQQARALKHVNLIKKKIAVALIVYKSTMYIEMH